jgi:1-acyl-sn-glycerol-3-phosphate acyltransferase
MTAPPQAGIASRATRTLLRGLILAFGLSRCFIAFTRMWLPAVLRGRRLSLEQRAQWLQDCAHLALDSMGIHYRIQGKVPTGITLLVANHLSYLDILICASALPCAFVAKREIATWPIFGKLAHLGATLFVNRESRNRSRETVEQMARRLSHGVPVLFFPEGTSTDGSQVIRFHSALFDPAINAKIPVTPVAIFYETSPPLTERDLCWFGDETFFPHMLRVLGVSTFTAVVQFGHPEIYPDRRTAAWRTHDTIEQMRHRHHYLSQKSPKRKLVS